MLVLTRKINETVVIGTDIRITITSVSGRQVGIGIEAPDALRIDREEIHIRKEESENGRD